MTCQEQESSVSEEGEGEEGGGGPDYRERKSLAGRGKMDVVTSSTRDFAADAGICVPRKKCIHLYASVCWWWTMKCSLGIVYQIHARLAMLLPMSICF